LNCNEKGKKIKRTPLLSEGRWKRGGGVYKSHRRVGANWLVIASTTSRTIEKIGEGKNDERLSNNPGCKESWGGRRGWQEGGAGKGEEFLEMGVKETGGKPGGQLLHGGEGGKNGFFWPSKGGVGIL